MEQLILENNIDKKEKQEKIVNMFDNIASTYDLTNRVLSMGIDIKWRRTACEKAYEILDTKELTQITDVACGTGDLLLFWKEYAEKKGVNVQNYVGVDPSVGMLEVARKKIDFVEFKEALQNSNIPIIVQVLDWHRIPENFHKNILENCVEMVKVER